MQITSNTRLLRELEHQMQQQVAEQNSGSPASASSASTKGTAFQAPQSGATTTASSAASSPSAAGNTPVNNQGSAAVARQGAVSDVPQTTPSSFTNNVTPQKIASSASISRDTVDLLQRLNTLVKSSTGNIDDRQEAFFSDARDLDARIAGKPAAPGFTELPGGGTTVGDDAASTFFQSSTNGETKFGSLVSKTFDAINKQNNPNASELEKSAAWMQVRSATMSALKSAGDAAFASDPDEDVISAWQEKQFDQTKDVGLKTEAKTVLSVARAINGTVETFSDHSMVPATIADTYGAGEKIYSLGSKIGGAISDANNPNVGPLKNVDNLVGVGTTAASTIKPVSNLALKNSTVVGLMKRYLENKEDGSFLKGIYSDSSRAEILRNVKDIAGFGKIIAGVVSMKDSVASLARGEGNGFDKAGNVMGSLAATSDIVGSGVELAASAGVESGFLGAAGAVSGVVGVSLGLPAIATAVGSLLKQHEDAVTTDRLTENILYDHDNLLKGDLHNLDKASTIQKQVNNQYASPQDRPRNIIMNNSIADMSQSMSGANNVSSGEYDTHDMAEYRRPTLSQDPFNATSNVTEEGTREIDATMKYTASDTPPEHRDLVLSEHLRNALGGPHASRVSVNSLTSDIGYRDVGGENFERVYKFGGNQQDPNDKSSAVLALQTGSAYVQKTVNKSGNWDLMVVEDQPIAKKDTPYDFDTALKNDVHTVTDTGVNQPETSLWRSNRKTVSDSIHDANFPTNANPVITHTTGFSREITTNPNRRMEIQIGNQEHPMNINLRNADDSLVFKQEPKQDITVSALAGWNNAIAYPEGVPPLLVSSSTGSSVYQFNTGAKLTINGVKTTK